MGESPVVMLHELSFPDSGRVFQGRVVTQHRPQNLAIKLTDILQLVMVSQATPRSAGLAILAFLGFMDVYSGINMKQHEFCERAE